jgi:hypothetical protein
MSIAVRKRIGACAVAAMACVFIAASPAAKLSLVHTGPNGKLVYTPDAQGNTIPDFSNCGYMGGGVALPDAAVKVTLKPQAGGNGDDTQRIQRAIDDVAKMPADANGLRGAVLLSAGTYRIGGQLKITTGGVVLRGEGDGERGGTLLIAAGKEKRALIDVRGKSGATEDEESAVKITDQYVPVGARSFTVADASSFKVGEPVIVRRVGNKAWISAIGMDRIKGRPGNESSTKQWEPFNLNFERVITAIDGNKVTIDAPIVCAIEQRWGGGSLMKSDDAGRIEQVGIEHLRGDSEFDPKVTKQERGKSYPADENHADYLVSLANVKNAWVRNVTAVHFYNGVSNIVGGAKWVTVQDSRSLEPVSEITGGRRYPFAISGGQLSLYLRCYSSEDRHAFVVGSRVCGPNAFVECVSENAHATSEPHHRWSVGGLYDCVKANIAFQDRQWMGSGHGWAGANYVAWNCEGSLVCQKPPTANNWAIGFVGKKEPGAFERPDGTW